MSANSSLALRRARLHRQALLLAYATVAYNAAEAVIAIWAGRQAGSLALVSFGGDSIVECLSALVIVWQFRADVPETRERQALRGIAVAFFTLAAFVAVDAVRTLVTGADPDPSPVGIGLAVASLVVMPVLAWAKRRVGRELRSSTVTADSLQTLLCTYLSAVLLAGLLLNASAAPLGFTALPHSLVTAAGAQSSRPSARALTACVLRPQRCLPVEFRARRTWPADGGSGGRWCPLAACPFGSGDVSSRGGDVRSGSSAGPVEVSGGRLVGVASSAGGERRRDGSRRLWHGLDVAVGAARPGRVAGRGRGTCGGGLAVGHPGQRWRDVPRSLVGPADTRRAVRARRDRRRGVPGASAGAR